MAFRDVPAARDAAVRDMPVAWRDCVGRFWTVGRVVAGFVREDTVL